MLKQLAFPATGAMHDDAVLEIAVRFARAHDARLAVFVSATIPTPTASPWGIGADTVIAELLSMVERESTARAEATRARLRGADVAWDVRMDHARFGDPALAFARQARYSDMVVLGKPAGDDAAIGHAYFNAALFESGRPVLVVPPRLDEVPRVRRMLVAWKPTQQATRAVHDAIAAFAPESVEVLRVDAAASDDPEPGAELAAHLARHGIATQLTHMPSASKSVATTVLLHAAATRPDLVVAGGYGHARLRERILGGSTRELLEQLELPVLFSH